MRVKQVIASEYQECLYLVEYLEHLRNMGRVTMYTHIPNSTYTSSWAQKRKNMRMGVSKGVPDYMILLKNSICFIEMKMERRGTVSLEQAEWMRQFNALGIPAKVCRGFVQAKEFIEEVEKL